MQLSKFGINGITGWKKVNENFTKVEDEERTLMWKDRGPPYKAINWIDSRKTGGHVKG